jgi:hypothetical protein
VTSAFWTDDLRWHPHGTPQNPHTYGTGPSPRDRRECQTCHRWRPPVTESLTVHPADRQHLNKQLPTARIYGEPLPDGCLILEDPTMTVGTLRVRIEGHDITVTLDRAPAPRWMRCDPVTGLPPGA